MDGSPDLMQQRFCCFAFRISAGVYFCLGAPFCLHVLGFFKVCCAKKASKDWSRKHSISIAFMFQARSLYPTIARALKAEYPSLHIHAFSPEEVLWGAQRSRRSGFPKALAPKSLRCFILFCHIPYYNLSMSLL